MTYNFCAGPAALPRSVMEKAQAELLDWQGLGISVMEISHRSSEYQALTGKAESDLRELLGISDEYAVLFMHGGASLQFSTIAMSLLGEDQKAEYLCNGMWSQKAAIEAARFGGATALDILDINEHGIRSLKPQEQWQRLANPAYTHYTPNETIEGIRFPYVVDTRGALIADMSSCILSEVINIDDYDLIYAGAQKNIGPAGMTIVIVRRALFEQMNFQRVPKVFNYQLQSEQGSMLNTPPTYTWYLAGMVFEWLLRKGGVTNAESVAIERAQTLYKYIDADDFYSNPIAVDYRSRMNIPFILADETLNDQFLAEAKQAGLVGLKGHRSIGGMRASLYNSMPMAGVQALVEFMADFKRRNG